MNAGITAINEEVERRSAFVQPLLGEMGKVVIGQRMLVERLIIGLLANGHVLLEGVPGLAKTLSIKSLAQCIDADFARLQFTPDMHPFYPAWVKVLRPRFQDVAAEAAMSHPVMTLEGWDPMKPVKGLIRFVQSFLERHGRVALDLSLIHI